MNARIDKLDLRAAVPLAAALLLLAALPAAAQTTPIAGVSRPVGYVRVDLPPEGFALTTLPFDPFAETLAELLDGQLAEGDSLLLPDAASGVDTTALVCDADGRWLPVEGAEATPLAAAGAVFWLRNAGNVAQTAFLSGELVLDEVLEIDLPPGKSFAGYPFLRAFVPGTAGGPAASAAGPNDRLFAWDAATATWLEGGASGTPPRLIPPGEGFAYTRAGDTPLLWSEPRPWLTNPFPAPGGLPSIEALEVFADPLVARLLVRSAPGRGRPVYILCQDLADDGSFDPFAWRLAGSFETGGSPLYVWDDAGYPPVTAPRSRCYLAVCGLTDSDGDGIPDGLEVFLHHTNPHAADSDGDGMPDDWELAHGLNPRDAADAASTPFGDGFTTLDKYRLGLDPRVRAIADASGKTGLRILTPLE